MTAHAGAKRSARRFAHDCTAKQHLARFVAPPALAIACLLTGCGSTGHDQSDAKVIKAESSVAQNVISRRVTFNRDVAPILFMHCAGCHRPIDDGPAGRPQVTSTGDPLCVAGAPFSVLDYASVQRRAGAIASAVTRRAMPPWLPVPAHGEFLNERRLTETEIATVTAWAAQGAPEGDGMPPPPPPSPPGGWQLGAPDLVLTLPKPYTLGSGDRDVFRTFVLPVSLTTTRYVRGVEFRTDNPRVLHHANLALDPGRVARALDRIDADPGFANMPDDDAVQNVYGWSPGKVPAMEPADTAWAIEPASDLVMQLHMIGGGSAQSIQPKVGLFFNDRPPTREPVVIKLESKAIDIAAGDGNYVIEDQYVLPVDVEAVSIYPHAHYLAKTMQGTAMLPDGSVTPLLLIERWDIRWQDQYRYKSPVALPKGTRLAMRFTYDNSAANPGNRRRPPQRVQWGPLSTDEMGALWLEVVPRRRADAAILAADYFRRARLADIASAELAVRRSPADAIAHNRLAMKYLQDGRAGEARTHLEEAVRLQPAFAEAHSNLGTVLQSAGRLEQATEHLREAVRLKPEDDRVHFNLGNGLLAAGRADLALREFEAAIARNPDNAEAHFNVAMLLGPANRVSEAITHLRRVVEIAPRNGDAHRNLAFAYALQGRLDEAIREARHAVRLLPRSQPAREQLDRLLAARGRR